MLVITFPSEESATRRAGKPQDPFLWGEGYKTIMSVPPPPSVLRFEPGSVHMLQKYSITELHLQLAFLLFILRQDLAKLAQLALKSL